MSALWFTYIALFLFSLLPNWEIYLSTVEIIGISTGLTVLLNVRNLYRDGNLFDERRKRLSTNGMAWGFVVLSLALVPAGTAESEITKEMVRETASLGLWTWLIYFSLGDLHQRYGDDSP
nr:MAG: hypothetical protein J07AB56_01300 [Candidatus Nanosalinarum sp. J07AB56]